LPHLRDIMSRTGLVVVLIVAAAGCGAPAVAPTSSPTPAGSSLSEPTDSTTSVDALPQPDRDGNPACADYDSWRPSPDGAGISVTWWNEGSDDVTVRIQQQNGPELSQQSAADDPTQRHQDFKFIDVDPHTVAEVLVITATKSCYVQPAPSS
jgi:hypothetical protein